MYFSTQYYINVLISPDKELYQLAIFGELKALFPSIQLHIELVGLAVPQFRFILDATLLCNFISFPKSICLNRGLLSLALSFATPFVNT